MEIEPYRRLIEGCFPRVRIATVIPNLEGWDNVVLEVNGELIFRFPRRPDVEAQFEKEVRLLPELARVLPAPVPRFEFVWPGDARWPRRCAGYRKITGAPLTRDRLLAGRPARLAGDLAAFLAALHRFPVERAVVLGVPDADAARWRQRYQAFYDEVRERVWPLLERPARATLAVLWDAFLGDERNFRFRPALIHADLGGGHILCDPTGAALAGVIDWGDAAIGDPALDFVGLLHDLGRDFTERVRAEYAGEADATFWQRAVFYARIIPLHEIVYGLATDDAAHVRPGLERLETVLREYRQLHGAPETGA